MKTLNNLIMTEVYTSAKKIKTKVSSGFASVSAKGNLIPLKVLEDATIIKDGEKYNIIKGCHVLIKEELLHTQQHLLERFQIEEKGDPFMLIPFDYVVGEII